MTYDQFEQDFYNKVLPNKPTRIRAGQALMNYLRDVWPIEYVRMSSVHYYPQTNIDCFYNDHLIKNALAHLKKVWHKK